MPTLPRLELFVGLWRRWQALSYHDRLGIGLLGLVVAGVAALGPPLSQDGPAHLYNARLLGEKLGAAPPAVYEAAYKLQLNALTNWLDHLLLAGLIELGLGGIALRCITLLYLLAFSLGFRSLIHGYAPRGHPVQLAAGALLFSLFLYKGFFNFLLGMSLALGVLGLSQRLLQRPQPGLLLAACAGAVLTYLAHAFMFSMMLLLMGCLWGGYILRVRPGWGPALQRAAGGLLIALPGLAGVGWYLSQQEQGPGIPIGGQGPLASLLYLPGVLPRPDAVAGVGAGLLGLGLGLLFLQAVRQAIAARRRPRKLGHRPQQATPTPWQAYSLGAGGGVLVLAFFLLPNEFAGGGYVKPRLAYLAGLMLLAALAALRLGPTKARICAALFVGALGALGLSYMHFQRHHSPALRAMAALGEQLPAHSAVLPVNYSEAPYTMHQLNYLVARQPLLLYENYEAYVGTFPLIWRPGSNAWGFMKGAGAQLGLEARPPWLPVGAFKRGGGAPAFVVTWQAPEQAPSSGRARRTYRWLQEHYRPVPSASELQGLRLYKRRPADQ